MQRYEYKVVEAHHANEAEKVMNDYARQGWRVISNVYWTRFTTVLIITFERELNV